MSLKSIYSSCMKSDLQALVIHGSNNDTLLGYRAFVYDIEQDKKYVYDFSISSDFTQRNKYFLDRVTKTISRVELFQDKSGKLLSLAERNSGQVVTEISKGRVQEVLDYLEVVFALGSRCSLR